MLQPLDQLEKQISRTEQQLMYHMILTQQETNRLLKALLGSKDKTNPVDDLKRQDLMKEIAKLENKPQGWNKWETEQMRNYLKEVS